MGLSCSDDIVIWCGCVQHHPHRFHVIAGVAPIPSRLQVAQVELLLKPQLNAAQGPRDLPRDECLTPAFGLVVEQDAIAYEQAVGLAVIDSVPVRSHLTGGIWTAWMKTCRFVLRWRRASEHFRRPGLIEPDLPPS